MSLTMDVTKILRYRIQEITLDPGTGALNMGTLGKDSVSLALSHGNRDIECAQTETVVKSVPTKFAAALEFIAKEWGMAVWALVFNLAESDTLDFGDQEEYRRVDVSAVVMIGADTLTVTGVAEISMAQALKLDAGADSDTKFVCNFRPDEATSTRLLRFVRS
jgi:hypothetical protein